MKRVRGSEGSDRVEEVCTSFDTLLTLSLAGDLGAALTLYQDQLIDRAFEKGLTMRSLKPISLEFHLSPVCAAHWIYGRTRDANLAPSFRVSGQNVSLTWKISNPTLASTVFGERFGPRLYPGTDGRVNFDPALGTISGTRRRGIIDQDNPLIIKYNMESQNCSLSFYSEKEYAVLENGEVQFVPYRV